MEKITDQQSTNSKSGHENNNDHEAQIGTTLKEFLRNLPEEQFQLHYDFMNRIVLTETQYDLVRQVYDKDFKESDSTFVYQLFQNFLYVRSS